MTLSASVGVDDRLSNVLNRLSSVAPTSKNQWSARCPAHNDSNASLSVAKGLVQDVILHCHAGCSREAVADAIGLTVADLCKPRELHGGSEPRGRIVATYDYRDVDGTLIFQAVRFCPKDFRQRKPDGRGGWDWKVKGLKVVPYKLPELLAADAAQPIIICEGEKDADKLWSIGIAATTNAGGAAKRNAKNPNPSCKWKQQHGDYLVGRHVVIVPDNDDPGRDHADGVARTLYGVAASVKVLTLDVPAKGDVSDWLDAGGTAEQLLQLASEAAEWKPTENQPEPANHFAPFAGYRNTDLGNAERFNRQHGDKVRFCFAWNKWLYWDGARWIEDAMGEIERLAQQTARCIHHEAADEKLDRSDAKEVSKWAHESEQRSRLQAMIHLARSQEPIPISAKSLDSEPWLLNCENGTVDLSNGILREHRQEDYLTKRCPVEYPIEAGDDPLLWLEFLDKIFAGNADLIGFVKRLIGLSLVGEVVEQILPIFWGHGSNGKSKLLEAWCGMLGKDYASNAPPGLVMMKKFESHPTELASLYGKRLVNVAETPEGGRITENLIKLLTGGDEISARRMREDFWTFKPSHTICLMTNHKPIIRGTDHAIWRRVLLVPFTVTITDAEKDLRIGERLKREWPAILRWAVDGCLEWQRDGLNPPAEVRIATDEFKTASDTLGAFIDECCLQGPGCRVKATILYQYYKQWLEANGEYVETQTKFGTRLSERGFEKVKSHGNVWWLGITNREVTYDTDPQAA